MEGEQDKLAEAKAVRERYRTKAFWVMFEVAVIFGVPAAIAFFVGRDLDATYGTGRKIVLSLLAFTFVLSWIITVFRYKQIMRQLKAADEKVKMERERIKDDQQI